MMLAQSNTIRRAVPRNIFEALEGEVAGEGTVVIDQPESVRRLIGGSSSRYGAVLGREGNTSLVMGYRIQLYNSNNASGRAEANRRAAQVRLVSPSHGCYISYHAPFWRLMVGDFLSHEDARQARAELIKLLPAWGKESYVVKDKVRILNYNPNEASQD